MLAQGVLRALSKTLRGASLLVAALDAVPALRRCITQIRVTRPYFDATPDAPDEVIKAELLRHPVFRLTPVRAANS